MKVVADDKIPYIRGRVERLADEVVYLPGSKIGREDVRDADVLLIRTRTLCNRQLLEGSRVRFIVTATIGYDHLDTEYLHEAGIEWTNCPGCNATSVAQYVRNALLVMETAGMVDLKASCVGIVGYGHVGKAVGEALRPYVKEILVNDPYKRHHLLSPPEGKEYILSPHTWFRPEYADTTHTREGQVGGIASCDIITLHTPLTSDGAYPTYHLVDKTFLGNLQRCPVIINAARGGVVDEAALLSALEEGKVRAAVIDTWENEPHINRQLLRQAFIATPHIAGYSADGKANASRMTLRALADWSNSHINLESLLSEIQLPAPDLKAGYPTLASRDPKVAYMPALSLYNPLADSERLKADAEGFEQQRGNYPVRRESW